MNTFVQVLAFEGAATVMAAKIAGRVIDQVARGFTESPELLDSISLFKAIQERYPETTITFQAMFGNMVKKAKTEVTEGINEALAGMTAEEQALWKADGDSEKAALLKAIPFLTKLRIDTVADVESWDNLSTIAQWSLLNSTEAALPGKLQLYASWVARDMQADKTNTNAMKLHSMTAAAIPAVFDIVSEFLSDETVKLNLAEDKTNGINVPPRLIAQVKAA